MTALVSCDFCGRLTNTAKMTLELHWHAADESAERDFCSYLCLAAWAGERERELHKPREP